MFGLLRESQEYTSLGAVAADVGGQGRADSGSGGNPFRFCRSAVRTAAGESSARLALTTVPTTDSTAAQPPRSFLPRSAELRLRIHRQVLLVLRSLRNFIPS
jgi:hypothetical protein